MIVVNNTNRIEAIEVSPGELPTRGVKRFTRITNEKRILELMRAVARGRMVCDQRRAQVPVSLGTITVTEGGRPGWALMARPTLDPPPRITNGCAALWFTDDAGIYGFQSRTLSTRLWRFERPATLVRYSRRAGPRFCGLGAHIEVRLPLESGEWITANVVPDISTGGLSVVLDNGYVWPDSALTQLEISLAGRKPFGTIVVVRHRREDGPHTTRYGLEFIELERLPRLAIERFTNSLQPLRAA